jgi:hypothetical protein
VSGLPRRWHSIFRLTLFPARLFSVALLGDAPIENALNDLLTSLGAIALQEQPHEVQYGVKLVLRFGVRTHHLHGPMIFECTASLKFESPVVFATSSHITLTSKYMWDIVEAMEWRLMTKPVVTSLCILVWAVATLAPCHAKPPAATPTRPFAAAPAAHHEPLSLTPVERNTGSGK